MNRSGKLKKNIIISVGLTGINLLISFLMYPMLIDLLGVSVYGSWLTIASIATWMTFFEFGLGSGLKNKLGSSISNGNFQEGKELVSTAYFSIGCIVCVLFIAFFIVRNYIDWQKLLNSELSKETLESFVSLMVCSYFLIFFFKLLGDIASANQEPFIEKIITTSVQLSSFIVVIILSYLHLNSIITLSIYWSVSSVLIWILFSILLYSRRYQSIYPSPSSVKLTCLKPLLNLGLQFFVIQLCIVLITGSTNFLISRFISSDEVVTYNAAYKLFSLSQILYSIIIAPTWPAFVDAIEKKDFEWIKRIIRKMIRLWMIITAGMGIILICSPIIFHLWLGDRIEIPFGLSALLFIYFSSMTFGGIFNMYVNATGNLVTQMICWVVVALIFIPTVILLVKYTDLGIYSVVIGLLLTNVYYLFFAPFQYHAYMKRITV